MNGKYIVEVVDGKVASQPVPYEPAVPQEGIVIPVGGLVTWVIGGFILLLLLIKSIVIVKQQTVEVIERLGKLRRMAKPGLSFRIPFIDWIVGELDLRVQETNISVETKTKDDVFVNVAVTVQYVYGEEKLYEAFYKLTNPKGQMTSYIFDVVRGEVPKLVLDSVFEQKDSIANAVKEQLQTAMTEFGIQIIQTLVTDIEPAEAVKNAMNTINEQKRLRIAATEKGEAARILRVKEAEAEAEAKKLSGEGIANQRKAIADGLKESIETVRGATNADTTEVMNLVLLTQYFDTLKDLGDQDNTKIVFLPSSPNGMTQFGNEIRTAIEGAREHSKL